MAESFSTSTAVSGNFYTASLRVQENPCSRDSKFNAQKRTVISLPHIEVEVLFQADIPPFHQKPASEAVALFEGIRHFFINENFTRAKGIETAHRRDRTRSWSSLFGLIKTPSKSIQGIPMDPHRNSLEDLPYRVEVPRLLRYPSVGSLCATFTPDRQLPAGTCL